MIRQVLYCVVPGLLFASYWLAFSPKVMMCSVIRNLLACWLACGALSACSQCQRCVACSLVRCASPTTRPFAQSVCVCCSFGARSWRRAPHRLCACMSVAGARSPAVLHCRGPLQRTRLEKWYGKGVDTETVCRGRVLEFLLVFGILSDPPGPILESVFLWCVSVDRNLPVQNAVRSTTASAVHDR